MTITLELDRDEADDLRSRIMCGMKIDTMGNFPMLDLASAIANAIQNADEAAYDRQQERLMETGGVDDSREREQLRDAGRGHLLLHGTQTPESGWYNSPDDLVNVITAALESAASVARQECALIAREVRTELKRQTIRKNLSQIDEHVAFVADSIAEKIEATYRKGQA